jgi:CHAT domain-containing protein/tetratricopeptide (TPR) repeat protein
VLRNLVLLLAFLLTIGTAHAQTEAPDVARQKLAQMAGQVQALLGAGRAPEAEAIAEAEVALARATFGDAAPETGAALSDRGEIRRVGGHLQEATADFERAEVLLAARGQDDPGLATHRYRYAELLRMQGKPEPALALYRRVEAVYAKLYGAKNMAVATCQNAEAEMLRMLGRPSEALPLHEKALAGFRASVGDKHPYVATGLQAQATTWQALGEYQRARAAFQEAHDIDVAALGPTHPWTATVANNLGEIQRLLGDLVTAEALFRQTLHAYEQSLGPQHPFVAAALINLGNVLGERGQDVAAGQAFARARAILVATVGPEHPDIATVLLHEATLARSRADWPAAAKALDKALRIREQALGPEHADLAFLLDAQASLALERGDLGAVEPLCRRSLQVRDRAMQHPEKTKTLLILAQTFAQLGDRARAEPLYRQALELARQGLGPEHPRTGQILDAIGGFLYGIGEVQAAIEAWKTSLAIAERTYGPEHPRTASALGNLAAAAFAQGRLDDALRWTERAGAIEARTLPADHPNRAVSVHNLAMLEARLGRSKQALGHFTQAAQLEAAVLGPSAATLGATLGHHADLLLHLGDLKGALAKRREAMQVLDRHLTRWLGLGTEAQKAALISQQLGHLYSTVDLAVRGMPRDPGAARLALEAVVRRKGLTIDAMADVQARAQSGGEDGKAMATLANLRARLAGLTLRGPGEGDAQTHARKLLDLEREVDQQESQLARTSAQFRSARQTPGLDEVAAALGPDTALLEYAWYLPPLPDGDWGKARYAAFVLTSSGVAHAVDLGEAATLEAAVAALRQVASSPQAVAGKADVQVLARDLDHRLLEPLRPYTGHATQLLLAPDAALSLVPFAALRGPDGKAVIERNTLTILGSGREVVHGPAPIAPREAELVLADPDFDETGRASKPDRTPPATTRGAGKALDLARLRFRPLQGTAEEAQAVGALWPHAHVLTGAKATEAALKSAHGPRILHLATHGWFLPAPPPLPPGQALQAGTEPSRAVRIEDPLLRSGLALAGFNARASGDEDGALTALEAASLDLSGTRLVVLSACNTGVGDTSGGFGVYGLRRAFAIAGAQALLMSLWSVDDTATRTLMTAFYGHLQRGVGRSEALRRAQLQLLAEPATRHPFFWAAFQLAGDGRPL